MTEVCPTKYYNFFPAPTVAQWIYVARMLFGFLQHLYEIALTKVVFGGEGIQKAADSYLGCFHDELKELTGY